jgi:hypothetical protein
MDGVEREQMNIERLAYILLGFRVDGLQERVMVTVDQLRVIEKPLLMAEAHDVLVGTLAP